MIVCLVRHGETSWNKARLVQGLTDNPLNDAGRRQAERVGAYLKTHDREWDLIVTSPLKRARETAEIIARAIGYDKPLLVDGNFRERSFGALEGRILDDETYRVIFAEEAPGLEKLRDLRERAITALLALEGKADKVLICAHAQVIKGIITAIDPEFDFRFPLKNSSMNYFEVLNGKIKIIDYNITPEK